MKTQSLFEMNSEMEYLLDNLCDPETGELNDDNYARLKALEVDIDEKREAWCVYIKQRKAYIDAKKEMLKQAKASLDADERDLERAKNAFELLMGGEKWKGKLSTVYYRTSESVEFDEGFEGRDITVFIPEEYLKFKAPEMDKTKLKDALKSGEQIPGVHIKTSTSMCIK